MAKSYSYDAYGTIVDQTGTVEQPYTYTGREFDSESGLMYYRARYYDPRTGRFLQKDPIGFIGGINLYEYVKSQPTKRNDPFGLKPSDCFDSEIDALFDAIKEACKYEQDRERGGYIYKTPTGKYRYTYAVGLEGGIVALDKPGDVGNEIVAAWHTHPEGGTPDFTRPHDLQDGRKNYLGLPGCKGILMYVPDPALDYDDRTMRIR